MQERKVISNANPVQLLQEFQQAVIDNWMVSAKEWPSFMSIVKEITMVPFDGTREQSDASVQYMDKENIRVQYGNPYSVLDTVSRYVRSGWEIDFTGSVIGAGMGICVKLRNKPAVVEGESDSGEVAGGEDVASDDVAEQSIDISAEEHGQQQNDVQPVQKQQRRGRRSK